MLDLQGCVEVSSRFRRSKVRRDLNDLQGFTKLMALLLFLNFYKIDIKNVLRATCKRIKPDYYFTPSQNLTQNELKH